MTEDRENALQHAATRRGLSLICMADGSYALARYECTGATLDEIQAYLGTDGISEREQKRHQAEERERQRAATEAMHNRLREIALEMSKLSARKTDPALSRNAPARVQSSGRAALRTTSRWLAESANINSYRLAPYDTSSIPHRANRIP
jgi:hypothetical protein